MIWWVISGCYSVFDDECNELTLSLDRNSGVASTRARGKKNMNQSTEKHGFSYIDY